MFGLAVSALGAMAAVLFWEHGLIGRAGLAVALFSPVTMCSRRWSARQSERARAEEARARAEWAILAREVVAALRTGVDVDRMLRDRGYRDLSVRRWIAFEATRGP